ncbi:MAG: asparaginase domain-containing protein [Elainellaceae cyanobacterium]
MESLNRLKIAVFSGPTATIHNSEPLVTSNKARAKHNLPLLTHADGSPARFDVLRPQRLAAPVTVYIEQFSAHPLEQDAAELYAPPDGYVDQQGTFHETRQSPNDKPVYAVVLDPSDGLYPLPYMAVQANGHPWEADCASPLAAADFCRQPFYPDASRIFEEIDRLGVGHEGIGNLLASKAEYDFYRAAPPGGYKKGLPAAQRTDVGIGDISPETLGEDFFPYRPEHIAQEPSMATLASLTNVVQAAMNTNQYAGAIWFEGSPTLEETTYWLNLLIDTTVPICGNAAQRVHGSISNDGDRNIVDSVDYILSKIWADAAGQDIVGSVVIQEEQIFTARDVQKGDARPGNYIATGGHGGIVGTIGDPGPPALTFRPVRRHTYCSAVNLKQLPEKVLGVQVGEAGARLTVPVLIKDSAGQLLPSAIPKVTIVKYARYLSDSTSDEVSSEVEIWARIEKNLRDFPLAGFIGEGKSPYGSLNETIEAALTYATFSGMPIVLVGRGNAEGFTQPRSLFLGGNNLTATKARILLMACLMKLGSLPAAANPYAPTEDEIVAVQAKLKEYQQIFDTH